jgi:Auxiliary Activity family 9 (formerly GH61)
MIYMIRLAGCQTGPAGFRCVSFLLLPGHTTYQRVNTTVNDKPVTVTLPMQDAPEDYLVWHDIIALHLAVTVGGAEFYPFCTQICIGLAQPNRILSLAHTMTTTHASTIRAFTYPELPTFSLVRPCRTSCYPLYKFAAVSKSPGNKVPLLLLTGT